MATTKTIIRSGDSRSLWNRTPSPGWTQEEQELLRLAIMKYGYGRWVELHKSNVLPGKTTTQCRLMSERLMGQQSLGEFMGLHVDVDVIARENQSKQSVKRKNGMIINTGATMTMEERARLLELNRKRYELSRKEIDEVVLPDRSKEMDEKKIYMQRITALQKRLDELSKELDRRNNSNGDESDVDILCQLNNATSLDQDPNGNKSPKKRGRKPSNISNKNDIRNVDSETNTHLTDTPPSVSPKKRGRKPKVAVIAEHEQQQIVSPSIATSPKKRGRKPKIRVENATDASVHANGITPSATTDKDNNGSNILGDSGKNNTSSINGGTPSPKKRGRKPKSLANSASNASPQRKYTYEYDIADNLSGEDDDHNDNDDEDDEDYGAKRNKKRK